MTSQGRLRGDVVEYCVSQFQFADRPLVVSSASGVINQQGRSFTHGFEIHLEKATLYFDLAVLAGGQLQITPLTLLDGKGRAEQPKLPAGDPMLAAFEYEIRRSRGRWPAENRPLCWAASWPATPSSCATSKRKPSRPASQ